MPEGDLVSNEVITTLAAASERVDDPTLSDEQRQDARATFAALVATHLPYRRDWRFLIGGEAPPGEATNDKARRLDATLKLSYLKWTDDRDAEMAGLGKALGELDQWTSGHTDSSSDAEIVAFPLNDNWGDGTDPEMATSTTKERPSRSWPSRPTPGTDDPTDEDEAEPPFAEAALPSKTRNQQMTRPETPVPEATTGPTTGPPAVVVTATMIRDKDTKNTVRYAETPGGTPSIGTIYVPKHSVVSLGTPDAITVTVTVA